MTLTVGSLFSGIGGLDLGLERAGMRVIWQSEIDPYACRVLAKHWPEVPNHGDIKRIDWGTVERPDVLAGGYPCQPFSTAGKRKGEEDPRHLWPWVRDAISHLRPRFAILENVRGHLSLGGTVVLGELAEIGYDAEWRVVSAAGLGAPHRRDRIIIVAYPNGSHTAHGRQREAVPGESEGGGDDRGGSGSDTREVSMGGTREIGGDVADAHGLGAQVPAKRRHSSESVLGSDGTPRGVGAMANPHNGRHVYAAEAIQPDIGRRSAASGREQWETEPDVGRVAHGVPSRVDRLRGLGNAVVPQVAEYIGRLVMAAA